MAKLRFEIESERSGVAFQSFIEASADFLGLLREIDQVMTGRYLGSLRWYIDDLRRGPDSLVIDIGSRVKPLSPSRKKRTAIPTDMSRGVASSLVTGFDNVQNLGISPPYLSTYGLQNLSSMLKVLEKNCARGYKTTDLEQGRTVELSQPAVETVRALIPTRRKTVGSIEGQLEAISIHGKKKFVVYDALTKKAISCGFSDEMLEEVKHTLGKRVLVSGAVHWNVKSEPNRVDVEQIRVLGEQVLPTTEELRGAYPNITDGMTTEEYIRSIRGD